MARLRIISGKYGGRWISADVTRVTHPMGDRIRSALFSSLASRDVLGGANVLDAFAGTGAVGFEALSRGVSSVVFVEKDKNAARVIQQNIELLGVADRARLVNATVLNWLSTRSDTTPFDIIFCDPPYRKPQLATVVSLAELLADEGLMVLSLPSSLNITPKLPDWLRVTDERNYGEAKLVFIAKA